MEGTPRPMAVFSLFKVRGAARAARAVDPGGDAGEAGAPLGRLSAAALRGGVQQPVPGGGCVGGLGSQAPFVGRRTKREPKWDSPHCFLWLFFWLGSCFLGRSEERGRLLIVLGVTMRLFGEL